MASERQIAANRLNALKSRGPTSAAGREKSSRNSLRHGMLANTIVIDGESDKRFAVLLSAMLEEFEPQTGVEAALVETLAVTRWRLMRVWGLEKACISHEISKRKASSEANNEPCEDASIQAALAFRHLSDTSRVLENMNRYESRYDRQYTRTLDRLLAIRKKRNFPNEPNFQDGMI